VLALAVLALCTPTVTVSADDQGKRVAIRDDCDPDDPAWERTGGCTLRGGDVTEAEFGAELFSPVLADMFPIGHQAWRNDPSYLKVKEGDTVKVRNEGGRRHTFTRVAQFGGGRVPPLNGAMLPAPECSAAMDLDPGDDAEVGGLAPGNHRFQCCIHPWMRALIKVEEEAEDEEQDEE
jgi:plastocyanin